MNDPHQWLDSLQSEDTTFNQSNYRRPSYNYAHQKSSFGPVLNFYIDNRSVDYSNGIVLIPFYDDYELTRRALIQIYLQELSPGDRNIKFYAFLKDYSSIELLRFFDKEKIAVFNVPPGIPCQVFKEWSNFRNYLTMFLNPDCYFRHESFKRPLNFGEKRKMDLTILNNKVSLNVENCKEQLEKVTAKNSEMSSEEWNLLKQTFLKAEKEYNDKLTQKSQKEQEELFLIDREGAEEMMAESRRLPVSNLQEMVDENAMQFESD